MSEMSAKELMEQIVKLADSKKAGDITVLHVGEQTTLTDYFVIMTGMSGPHLRALSEEIEVKLKEKGVMPHHVEGVTSSWVLHRLSVRRFDIQDAESSVGRCEGDQAGYRENHCQE